MSWLLIFVLCVAGYLVFKAVARASNSGNGSSTAPASNVVWDGDGTYGCEVVGESHYQESLRMVATVHERDAHGPMLALLTPEADNPHDRNAVSVKIGNRHVGYLPKGVAPAYRQLLEREGKPLTPVYAHAKLIGGHTLANGSQAHYGVVLDIADL